MTFFQSAAKIIRILPNLVKAPLSRRKKILILLTYIKLRSVMLFKGNNKGSVRLLGFTVEYFDYKTLIFLYEEIFFGNEYVFACGNANPVIFDCGANIGMATLYFSWLFPKATIIAIEPDPSTFALLVRNVEQNKLSNVRLHNIALSDVRGSVEFFTNSQKPGSLRMGNEKRPHIEEGVIVQAEPLSFILNEEGIATVDFLKLDVEGAEWQVIDDLKSNNLLPSITKGVIEYHHRIAGKESSLGAFLTSLEECKINYQISARFLVEPKIRIFQDILIYFTSERPGTTSQVK